MGASDSEPVIYLKSLIMIIIANAFIVLRVPHTVLSRAHQLNNLIQIKILSRFSPV